MPKSPGAIIDRQLEHLGPSDQAVSVFGRWAVGEAKRTPGGGLPQTVREGFRDRANAIQIWVDDDRPFETLLEARPMLGTLEVDNG